MEKQLEFVGGYTPSPNAQKFIEARVKDMLDYYARLDIAQIQHRILHEYRPEDIIAEAARIESDEQMLDWLGRRKE